MIPGDKHEVVFLAASPDKQMLAAGFTDGSIKIYDLITGDNLTTFSGHRTAVTCLVFDKLGHRLASGSKV